MSAQSLSEYSTPLVLDVRPSRRLRRLAAVVHLGVPVLAAAAWGTWLLAPASLASAMSYWWTRWHHLNSDSPKFVRRLSLTEDGHWLLQRGHGERRAQLSGNSLLLPGTCILVFRLDRVRRCAVVVDNSTLTETAFRRLRVLLNGEARKG